MNIYSKPVNDEIMIEKAKEFCAMLGKCEQTFSYSRGWLNRFKTRHKISQQIILLFI